MGRRISALRSTAIERPLIRGGECEVEEPVVGMTRTESWPEPVRLIDPDSSLTEEVGFFPGEGGPLYGVHHRTRSDAGFGVVIAPPFLMEFQRNYRRDVLLARALAVIGVPSFRFSYRGQGHSVARRASSGSTPRSPTPSPPSGGCGPALALNGSSSSAPGWEGSLPPRPRVAPIFGILRSPTRW